MFQGGLPPTKHLFVDVEFGPTSVNSSFNFRGVGVLAREPLAQIDRPTFESKHLDHHTLYLHRLNRVVSNSLLNVTKYVCFVGWNSRPYFLATTTTLSNMVQVSTNDVAVSSTPSANRRLDVESNIANNNQTEANTINKYKT